MSSRQEHTLEEVAPSSVDAPGRSPVLFIVLEADRPLARGARHSLVGVERITIGRGEEREAVRQDDGRALDVRVPGKWISSRHAILRAVAGEWIVEDAGSRNGTFVNGERVQSAIVRDGDIVQAGRVFFMVRGAPLNAPEDAPQDAPEDAPQDAPQDAPDESHASSVPSLSVSRSSVSSLSISNFSSAPFGLRTLLPELEESHTSLVRVARGSLVPILFLGPTGSGKEVLAREVHAQSKRTGEFVAVNCGALSPMLVESLLFGHVKGAFSGATRDEPGFVRSAHGGTLFLDEIGDLPPSSQAALLRVLQEHEVVAVGATRATKVDVRVVAATHRPLEALSASGAFRADLLARLKGYTHRLLPLHKRMPDFGLLLADVLERIAGPRAEEITLMPDAAQALMNHSWPHNIRELYHALASTIALGGGDVLEARHLPSEVLLHEGAIPEESSGAPPSEDLALRDRLVLLLREHHGNLTAVARVMGKGPTQIYRWIRRFELPLDTYRRV